MPTYTQWRRRPEALAQFMADPSISPILRGLMRTMPMPDRFGDLQRLLGTNRNEERRMYALVEYAVRRFLPAVMETAERNAFRYTFRDEEVARWAPSLWALGEVDSKKTMLEARSVMRQIANAIDRRFGRVNQYVMFGSVQRGMDRFLAAIDTVDTPTVRDQEWQLFGSQCGTGILFCTDIARARIAKMYPPFIEEMIG